MTTYPGRGAWTAVGKDNGWKTYRYLSGKPLDGHRQPDGKFASINHEAVNLGVLAIQKRINVLGCSPRLTEDGVLGMATDKGIRWVQTRLGVTSDGDCGPTTSRMLWHPLVAHAEQSYALPRHILWGIARHESLLDPGAVGATTPADRGLVQFNTSLGTITIAQAHDPVLALDKAAQRLHGALGHYTGKGTTLQVNCTIASWNSPVWADQWFRDGKAPNDQIAKYVADVLAQTDTF